MCLSTKRSHCTTQRQPWANRLAAFLIFLTLGAIDPGQSMAIAAESSEQPITLSDIGFQSPESVLHDTQNDIYLVSNINGNIPAEDDNGFISKVAPDGSILELKWIDGAADEVILNSPKGMAIVDDVLYVADLSVVRTFDLATGAPLATIAIPNATFLNDLAAGTDGSVYGTDSGLRPGPNGLEPSGTDSIYRIALDGSITKLARGTQLGQPNGIMILESGEILSVTRGESREIYTLGADGTRENVRVLPATILDGVVSLSSGTLLISSWETSSVYRLTPDGQIATFLSALAAPAADMGYDESRNRLLMPLLQANQVVIQPLAEDF